MNFIVVVMVTITVGLCLFLSGCQHNDGWTQDEVNWVIDNVR